MTKASLIAGFCRLITNICLLCNANDRNKEKLNLAEYRINIVFYAPNVS